jgi:hypothetical protein
MEFKFFEGSIADAIYDRHNTVWRTATGRHTPIMWLTNSHIINTLGCLRGVGLMEIPEVYEGKTKQEWIDILKTELRIRERECRQTVSPQ